MADLWIMEKELQFPLSSSIARSRRSSREMYPLVEEWLDVLDGELEIDMKNRVEAGLVLIENQIRPVALGRKNFLFAGSHTGAQRAALIYSPLGTCKLHNLDPFQWLKDVLERIPDHPINRIEELLPQNWSLKN